jgi:hypothetical protein
MTPGARSIIANMASKTTRREVLKAGVAGAVALSSGIALAQGDQPEPVDTGAIEKQLAKPLPEPVRKLLAASIRNSRNASSERLKFKLPENSEPCTIYAPSAVLVVKKR